MSKKTTIVTLTAAVLIITGAVFSDRVFASTGTTTPSHNKNQSKLTHLTGIVQSVTGNTIVISDKNSVTYNIDTSRAKLFKGKNVSITISDIANGERIYAMGNMSQNTLIATRIFDTQKIKNAKVGGKEFQGVAGVVSSINGESITLTGKNNLVYVVDATNAQVHKGSASTTAQISQIQSGDTLFVRGTITGTNVVATNIFDSTGVHKKIKSKK